MTETAGTPEAAVSALNYAHLVGRYIRMTRDEATDHAEVLEWAAEGTTSVGMEAQVVKVEDVDPKQYVGGACVRITGDDGNTMVIWPDEKWRFTIWSSERMRRLV